MCRGPQFIAPRVDYFELTYVSTYIAARRRSAPPPDVFLAIAPEPFAIEVKFGMTDSPPPFKPDVMNVFHFQARSGH